VDVPFEFVLALAILVACVWVAIWASRRVRRGGGGATVGVLGATYEMLSEDKRRATETIVKQKAGETDEEDDSSDPHSTT
jgi:hypothetical protein